MARRPAPVPVPAHPAPVWVGLAGLGAFVATLVIPAVAALWWLLAVATVVSVASVTGRRLRPGANNRISPGAAGARGR